MKTYKVWIEIEEVDEDNDNYEGLDGGLLAEFDSHNEALEYMDSFLTITSQRPVKHEEPTENRLQADVRCGTCKHTSRIGCMLNCIDCLGYDTDGNDIPFEYNLWESKEVTTEEEQQPNI